MPQLNKVQVRALIRQLIDDPAGKLWSTENLDLLVEGALDELWGELLDQFPWIRSTETALAPTAPGYVDLSATNTNILRFYRVQAVVRNSVLYSLADQRDITVSNGAVIAAPNQSYCVMGSQLHLFPYETTTVYLRYSNRPEPFTSLGPGTDPDSGDDDFLPIEWPEGHQMAYIYDVASKALEKGDREDSAAFGKRAEQAMFRLRAYLRRQSTGGTMLPFTLDTAREWGGIE